MPTIKYEGHACFLITTDAGLRIMVDPYDLETRGDSFGYGPIRDPADVVLITHEHADHNGPGGVPGSPVVLRETGTAGGVFFEAVTAPHGRPGGQDRGNIRLFRWDADGLRFCHLGDLGELLTPEQVASLGPVDVLFVPVGGHFTVDATGAHQVARQLQARVIIPMHYRPPGSGFPVAGVEPFLAQAADLLEVGAPEWTVTAATLPEAETVVALTPAN